MIKITTLSGMIRKPLRIIKFMIKIRISQPAVLILAMVKEKERAVRLVQVHHQAVVGIFTGK